MKLNEKEKEFLTGEILPKFKGETDITITRKIFVVSVGKKARKNFVLKAERKAGESLKDLTMVRRFISKKMFKDLELDKSYTFKELGILEDQDNGKQENV